MRLAILGAFPFPYSQGSQVYAAQQAQALVQAGASVGFMNYGGGVGDSKVNHKGIPASLAPRKLRSGPQWRKPVADLALGLRYVAEHRKQPFDVALAHNAEAAWIAIAARRFIEVPVIYVAHTLWEEELSAYGTPAFETRWNRLGASVDSHLAKRADGVVALCPATAQTLAPRARGPVRTLPPGLESGPAPTPAEQASACAKHGLTPGHFSLYSGNLDRYQDLDLLAATSRKINDHDHPVVIATHDAGTELEPRDQQALRVLEVCDFKEMRALVFAAHTLLLPRKRAGGFPIKLLNYMEAAKPIVAFEHIAVGLEHQRSAWLVNEAGGPSQWAEALLALRRNPDAAAGLGKLAKRHLEQAHAWPRLAIQTLAFASEIRERQGRTAVSPDQPDIETPFTS